MNTAETQPEAERVEVVVVVRLIVVDDFIILIAVNIYYIMASGKVSESQMEGVVTEVVFRISYSDHSKSFKTSYSQ